MKSDLKVKGDTIPDPKVSIITVVRNGEKHLTTTIKSIINQTYDNLEYIIIDGNSTDGTIGIINKYKEKIAYWVSEEDKGIYDAMNKGVLASTGEWLLFINADDYLIDKTIIQQVVSHLKNTDSYVAYGNILFINPSGNETLIGSDWPKIKLSFRNTGMLIPHQGTFHSKKLFSQQLFNTEFKILADYNLLLSYLNKNDAYYIPLTISKMRFGGASYDVSPFYLLKESFRAQKLNGIRFNIFSLNWLYSTFIFLSYHLSKSIFGPEIRLRLKRKFHS